MVEAIGVDVVSLAVASVALVVSIMAFVHSLWAWRRSFRPIVTAMVRTVASGNQSTAYELVLLNSGSIPARDITLCVQDQSALEAALGDPQSHERQFFLACFKPGCVIAILQNGADVRCSFGYTGVTGGFWKHEAVLPIDINYRGWFGTQYVESQVLHIVDSTSFTGGYWSD